MPRRLVATVALLLFVGVAAGQPADRPPLPSGNSPPPAGDGLFPDDPRPARPPWQRRPSVDDPSSLRPDDYAPQASVRWNAPQPVQYQPTTLGLVRLEVASPIPILRDQDDLFVAGVRVRSTSFQTRAVLPDSGRAFPRQLWTLTTGFNYTHQFGDGVSAGMLVRFGSDSDKPFNSWNELTPGLGGFVRFPAAAEPDYWQISLTYFPTYISRYPLPGLVYEWNPDPDLRVGIGLPFSLFWRPHPLVNLDVSYVPLAQLTSRLNFDPRAGFRVYAGYDWQSEGYFLTDRPNRADLFFVNDMRVLGGVRYTAAGRVAIDLSAGYGFNRQFGMGPNALSLSYDRVRVNGGGFGAAAVLIFF